MQRHSPWFQKKDRGKLICRQQIAYSSTKTKDRKVLAKFKTFVKILAAYSSPQLQLRFLGDVKLIRSADQLVASFADLAAFGWAVTSLNMHTIWHAAMNDRWGGLQMMPSVLRIIREYCGTLRWHVFMTVHPVLLCQAREALVCSPILESQRSLCRSGGILFLGRLCGIHEAVIVLAVLGTNAACSTRHPTTSPPTCCKAVSIGLQCSGTPCTKSSRPLAFQNHRPRRPRDWQSNISWNARWIV